MNGGVNVAATLAVCFAIVAGSCGGESERRDNRDPGAGGATGATGGSVATGGSSATGGGGSDGGTASDGGTGSDGGAGGGAGAGDPSTVGCRDPHETGCATCCEQGGSNCVGRDSTGGSEPWYNHSWLIEGACPESCPTCAPCSSREESDLRNLGCRADCDCENIDIGIDPCFSPQSCACYCDQTAALRSNCPHVVPCD